MTQPNEIKDIINLLQGLDTETGFSVFIPSLQQDIKFKQLTTEQLKRLLKSVVDSPIYNTEFILTFNSIIKENCLDQTVNTDNLTVYDKLLIFFKTRLESISLDYNFTFTDEEVQQNNLTEKSKRVSLLEHYNNFAKDILNYQPETITLNNCSVTCNLPTLHTENKLEKELHKNVKIEVTTPEELRNIVGETFINEITKFITSISIDDKTIDLLSQSFKSRINLVEKLPTNIINKVIKYIENYRNSTKKLLTYKVPVETTSQTTVHIEKDIPFDASFFNM